MEFFFFFFKVCLKSHRRGAEVGGWRRWTAATTVAAGPNIFRLETCIGPIKWANILAITLGPFKMVDP